MKTLLTFIWKRTWCRILVVVVFLTGLTLVHPFIRQSIFGPTLDGIPWCVWEAEIEKDAHADARRSWFGELLDKIGIGRDREEVRLDIDTPKLVPVYLHLAESRDVKVRRLAIHQLANWIDQNKAETVPVLRRRLTDDDPLCRVRAAGAIWRMTKEREMTALVVSASNDPNLEVQRGAADALAQMAATVPGVFEPLAQLAGSPDAYVCMTVMNAMGQFGKRGVPVIRKGLANPIRHVPQIAVMAATRIGPDGLELIPDLVAMRNDPNPHHRRNVEYALFRIAPKQFTKPAD